MTLPRYSEYQDSGVYWLGAVPAHWRVQRLKNSIVSCKNGIWGAEPCGDQNDIECVRVADFDRTRLVVDFEVQTLRSVSEHERTGRLLARGDLLLEKSGGGEKQPVGQVVMYDRDVPAVCSNFVARVVMRDRMEPRFWTYHHAALYWFRVNMRSVKQTSGIQNLDQSQYFDELGVFPPVDEQSAIAAFLDRETAKVDALIAEQEKLITLLAEKRQAAISHAVTKGLNRDAQMKDSGVPCLGEVPAHWEVKSIGHVLDAIGDVDHFMPSSVDKGVPYLMTGDLRDSLSKVNLDSCKQVCDADYRQLSKRIRTSKGDVVMARYATIGTLMYVDIDTEVLVSYSCVTLKPNRSKVFGPYLFHYMRSDSFRQGVEHRVNTNTQGNLGITDLKSLKIVTPPIFEQSAIAAFLDSEFKRFEALTAESERAISLLKERRSALIAAAVTGQNDLRGVVEAEAA